MLKNLLSQYLLSFNHLQDHTKLVTQRLRRVKLLHKIKQILNFPKLGRTALHNFVTLRKRGHLKP